MEKGMRIEFEGRWGDGRATGTTYHGRIAEVFTWGASVKLDDSSFTVPVAHEAVTRWGHC